MGLLRWLKKNKSQSAVVPGKRRQSEPPMSSYNYDPNSNRESYLKAFEEFQERRTSGQNNDWCQDICDDEHNVNETANGSDMYSTVKRSNDQIVLFNTSNTSDSSGLRSQDLEQYLKGKLSRNSLPVKMPKITINKNSSSKKPHKKKKKKQQAHNNNSIIYENEVKDFENMHCNNNTSSLGPDEMVLNLHSPPSKFFRSNINPFPSPLAEKRTNEMFQQGCVSAKPQNNEWKSVVSLGESNFNGSYKHYELNSTNAEDVNLNVEQSDAVSVVSGGDESSSGICSGASSSEPLDKPNIILDQHLHGRHSFRYESEVNKYGDLVEYAMPHVVCNDEQCEEVEKRPSDQQKPMSTNDVELIPDVGDFSASDEVFVDKSFKFLNECQTSYVLSSQLPKCVTPKAVVRVTDLDESTDVNMTGNTTGNVKPPTVFANEMCQELSFLENWSDSLRQRNNSIDCVEKYKSNVALCKPKDIKYTRNMAFGNRFHTQLEYSCGTYRKANVTLRKCNPRVPEAVRLVEEAIEKDYDILRSEIKHPNIVMLMAACYNKKLINHMILVMEPCDFTLNYFLHQMNGHLTVFEAISIVQQIANATQYLHQFGYVHSNISSHCILIGQRSGHSLNAKLSSFELTTVIQTDEVRREVESRYDMSIRPQDANCSESSQDSGFKFLKERQKASKDKYSEKSKQPIASLVQPNTDHSYLEVASEFLPYNTNFRQHLSLFNYQAPELLITFRDYVFPTVAADVYALSLLLWEILNENVPYVVYSKYELQCIFSRGEMFLPLFEKQRCRSLFDVLYVGLESNPTKRKMTIENLIDKLNYAKEQCDLGEVHLLDGSNPRTPLYENSRHLMETNEKRTRHHTPNKKVVVEKPLPPIPLNEATVNLLRSKSIHPSNISALNKTSCSSLVDFNQALNNPNNKIVTSTLKRRKPTVIPRSASKKVTAALFQTEDDERRPTTNKKLSDISSENIESDDNHHIKSTPASSKKTTVTPHKDQNAVNLSPKSLLTNEKSKFLNDLLDPDTPTDNMSKKNQRNSLVAKSANNLLEHTSPTRRENQRNRRRLHKSLINSAPVSTGYGFEIGEFVLPNTPIARENKIRRNAWLSNQKINLPTLEDTEDEKLDEPVKDSVKKPARKSTLSKNGTPIRSPAVSTLNDIKSPMDKKINVSIKIVHNKISPATTRTDVTDKCPPLDEPHSKAAWTFGKNRRKSTDNGITNDHAKAPNSQYIGRKPTKLVYSESMLMKDEPIISSCNKSGKQTKDTSTEFNIFLSSCSTDNVTQDFQKILKDLDLTKKCSSEALHKTTRSVETQVDERTPQRAQSTPMIGCTDSSSKDFELSTDKRPFTPVKDTILQFENWLALNKTNSPALANSPLSLRSNNCTPIIENKQHRVEGEADSNVLQLPATSAAVQQHMSSVRKSCARSHSGSSTQGHTLIKRTIFTESIVSGVDYDSVKAAGGVGGAGGDTKDPDVGSVMVRETASRKKLTTCVTLNMRQTRRRQSIDASAAKLVNKMQQDSRHTMCGNEINALVNGESTIASSGSALCLPAGYEVLDVLGKPAPGRKYVCCNCASTIPHDQLRALTLPDAQSRKPPRSSDIFKTPLQRCMMSGSRQTMRSTEDFYIDDDFAAGLGANMELVSDTSDLFDITDYNDDD